MLRTVIIDDEPDCIVFLAKVINDYCPVQKYAEQPRPYRME